MSPVTRVAVVGLGYIGLPTAAALADRGVRVLGVDVNEATVRSVGRGEVPFVEPDLAEVVHRAVQGGALTAHTATPSADVYIVAVPTPFLEDRSADLSYVEAAVHAIAPQLVGGELIILESTSPPGTTERMGRWLQVARPDLALAGADGSRPQVSLAYCPERVLPGRIMAEIVDNDRVIGGLTPRCAERASDVYRIFCTGELHLTDTRTAELCKLVENSFRDVNIAFANELAGVCDELGIDVWRVIELANRHPRVDVLRPGPGVGGHCIAVDPWFIVAAAPERTTLIRAARETNDARPQVVVQQVLDALPDGDGLVVAALGLAFKADVDDLRGSPAMTVVERLADALAGRGEVLAAEPYVDVLPPSLQNRRNVSLCGTEEAIGRADLVVLLVDHRQFRDLAPEPGRVAVVDTRGLWRVPTPAPGDAGVSDAPTSTTGPHRVVLVYGTRPEAIKMAPLVPALRDTPGLEPVVVVTGQHRHMLDQVNELFGIVPRHDLDVLRPGQSLVGIASRALAGLGDVLQAERPAAVVVQGDTTTSTVAALAAAYQRLPVVHLEAGLRTHDRYSPFPEEINRRVTAQLASLHLAPTALSRDNLLREGIPATDVTVTGNTVIDALLTVVRRTRQVVPQEVAHLSDDPRRVLLVTAHRRESWGEPMTAVARAVARVARDLPDVHVVMPLHLNPTVREAVVPVVAHLPNVSVMEPLDYEAFAWLQDRCHVVLTDSGGVQEEAPSLGKPVLVIRDNTERPEAVDAGTVRLVGTDEDRVHAEVVALFRDEAAYARMAGAVNPYGDGRAALRSAAAVAEFLGVGQRLDEFGP